MKKLQLFLSHTSLVLLLSFIAIGCSSENDEPMNPEAPKEKGTRHIEGTIITISGDESNYDGLYSFFNKELPIWSVSKQDNNFQLDNLSETCHFINSYEELRSIYTGKETLPNIDFGSYTLIVGQKCSNNVYDNFDKQVFYEKDGKYILDLFLSSEIVHPTIVYYNYWGLYPKLSNKEINVNLIINE